MKTQTLPSHPPTPPLHLIDPSNGAHRVSLRGACWISETNFLASVWEYFPHNPLIVEYSTNGHNCVLVDSYRIPQDTKGGCVTALKFNAETQEITVDTHMDATITVKLEDLRKNIAPVLPQPEVFLHA